MRLTDDLVQELLRLSAIQNNPVLAEAAERLELCSKSHNTIIRLLSRANEDLETVKSERDRMLEEMRGVCRVCVYHGTDCDITIQDFGCDCEHWKWRGDK